MSCRLRSVSQKSKIGREGLTLVTGGSTLEDVPRSTAGAEISHYIRQFGRVTESCMFVPLRSVDTPVEKRPVDATAREPQRSTRLARVPPWIVWSRFCRVLACRLVNAYRAYRVVLVNVELKVDFAVGGAQDSKLQGMSRSL